MEIGLKIVSQCCVCSEIKFYGNEYYKVPLDYIPGTVPSHGYCDECLEVVLANVRRRNYAAQGNKL